MDLSDQMLDALGNQMRARIDELRESTIERLHVKGRAAPLRVM